MDAGTFIFAVLGLAVLASGVFLLVRARARDKKERAEIVAKEIEQAQSDIERMEAAEGDISKLPDLTDQVEGLILGPEERCFALCRGAQHVVQALPNLLCRRFSWRKFSDRKRCPLSDRL